MKKIIRLALSKSGIRSLVDQLQYQKMMREWKVLAEPERLYDQASPSDVVVVLTPAPLYLTSSKGDEAMLVSTIQAIRTIHPGSVIFAATASDVADARAKKLGVEHARILESWSLSKCLEELRSLNPAHVYVIGADVMDGGYNPRFSLRLIALGDLACRSGAQVRFLGFSFKKRPFKHLGLAFDKVHKDVIFNLRDPRSFERFRRSNSSTSQMTADIAFLISAQESDRTLVYSAWIREQRSAGRKVIGVNLHHSLLIPSRRDETSKLIQSSINLLTKVQKSLNVSFLLLKHDFGDVNGDHHCMHPLYEALRSHSRFIKLQEEELAAVEMKWIVKDLDGVISARMHLAIASLGAGTPVYGLNYQDKMEGLFEHFSMGEAVFSDVDAIFSGAAEPKIIDFINDSDKNADIVRQNLDRVMGLSKLNMQ